VIPSLNGHPTLPSRSVLPAAPLPLARDALACPGGSPAGPSALCDALALAGLFPGWPSPASLFPVEVEEPSPSSSSSARNPAQRASASPAPSAAAAASSGGPSGPQLRSEPRPDEASGAQQQPTQQTPDASSSSTPPPPPSSSSSAMPSKKNKGGTGGAAGAGAGSSPPSPPIPVALAGSDMDSGLIRSSIPADSPAMSCAFPLGAESGGEHCWSQLDATTFQVRGPNYLEDKVKEPSQPAMFDLMHFDILRSNDKIGNLAARNDSWLRAARKAGDTRYYLVVVYVTPAAPYIHLALYFAVQPERVRACPHFSSLWEQFTAHGPAGDAFRDERWKVIPRVAEGSWIVSNAVGSKPALLAQKLTHTWILCDGVEDVAAGGGGGGVETSDAGCGNSGGARARGGSFSTGFGPGPYLEADCDVASSSMAFVLVSLLQSYAR
jgi:hypothetical protein